MPPLLYFSVLLFISFTINQPAFTQEGNDTTKLARKKLSDSIYIKRMDTLLHLQSWISAGQMDYTLVYDKDFKLVLGPNEITSFSFGLSYRYLDLSLSFTPRFLNTGQDEDKEGESERIGFRTSFSMHRFNLSIDLNSVKGFYLKNSAEFARSVLPDSPYVLYPDLKVGNFGILLRYNVNRKFSTAALTSGTQIQLRSAWTVLPSFQFATFKFHNDSKTTGVQNESTFSTDLNFLLPVAGTLVISPKFSASLGIGPSFGVDFFKSVSINDSGRVAITKGTKLITGYTLQTAISFNAGRFFSGIESRYRNYGHKIEDISRLIKQYSFFQLYVGWRLKAPGFAKKSLDWVNKISPIDLD